MYDLGASKPTCGHLFCCPKSKIGQLRASRKESAALLEAHGANAATSCLVNGAKEVQAQNASTKTAQKNAFCLKDNL